MAYYQGKYSPRNPQKYRGDPTNIRYRSGWELRLFAYLDKHPEVIWWQSEEVVVIYRSPVDKKPHRYFPDVVYKNKRGEVTMIEVKPKSQTQPPILVEGKKMSPAYKRAVVTYAINDAKWKAARIYCADRGWKFQIVSEKELGIS